MSYLRAATFNGKSGDPKDWIPMVINAAKPWLSKAHIPSGKLWRTELAENLATCKFGIFCLTPAAMDSHWMFFEAGAISKTVKDAHVCPVLIDLKPSEVESPFADFQCRLLIREDIRALIETLNTAVPDDARVPDGQLRSAFDALWPLLEKKLADLPKDGTTTHKTRDTGEILEEILSRVRALEQRDTVSASVMPSQLQRTTDLLRGAFPDLYQCPIKIGEDYYVQVGSTEDALSEGVLVAPLKHGQSETAFVRGLRRDLTMRGMVSDANHGTSDST